MILVFGGKGQLGRELSRLSAERRVAMVALGSDEVNIADRDAAARAISLHKPSLLINAAAFTNVDLAESKKEKARLSNEVGPAVVSEVCAVFGVPLVHISTDYVFDGFKHDPYTETDPVNPVNYYGASKAAGESAIRSVLRRHVILRTSWLYSEFGRNFLKTIVRLAATEQDLRVVDDQRGSPTSARRLAEAILSIAPGLVAGDENWGTYHFAGDGTTTWHGLAECIVAAQKSVTGHAPRVTPIGTADYPTAARRPMNSGLDSRLFTSVFGHKARSWCKDASAVTRAVVAAQELKAPHVA